MSGAGISITALYEAATLGSPETVREMLARVPSAARLVDPIAIGLRAMDAILRGDIAGGIALFARAAERATGRERDVMLELMIPYMISTGRIKEAEEALALRTGDEVELAPAFDALASIIAARSGRGELSRSLAASALAGSRIGDQPVVNARIVQRVAYAAFYREEFEEAQERSLESAHALEAIGAYRQVTHAYSLLYVIAHECIGDPDMTRLYAERMTSMAQRSGDIAMQNNGLVAQLEIAAQTGDLRRFGSIRARLLSNPRNEQFREGFAFTICDALVHVWNGQFGQARAILQTADRRKERTLQEHSLCNGFIALIDVGQGHLDAARKLAHRVTSQTAHRPKAEPVYDARTRRVARVLAACASILAGETTRGRRALTRFFDENGAFAELADRGRIDETAVPATMRGVARAVAVVQASLQRRAPAHDLTAAELNIMRRLISAASLDRIAAQINRSPNTVKGHVKSIYAKFEVSSRVAAVRRARELGIDE
jgi:DNA-binding CsgD family transcriptional regulator